MAKNNNNSNNNNSNKKTQMANKHIKVCSPSLFITEMEVKTTTGYHFTHPRMNIIRNTKPKQVLVRMRQNRYSPTLLVGMEMVEKLCKP